MRVVVVVVVRVVVVVVAGVVGVEVEVLQNKRNIKKFGETNVKI